MNNQEDDGIIQRLKAAAGARCNSGANAEIMRQAAEEIDRLRTHALSMAPRPKTLPEKLRQAGSLFYGPINGLFESAAGEIESLQSTVDGLTKAIEAQGPASKPGVFNLKHGGRLKITVGDRNYMIEALDNDDIGVTYSHPIDVRPRDNMSVRIMDRRR